MVMRRLLRTGANLWFVFFSTVFLTGGYVGYKHGQWAFHGGKLAAPSLILAGLILLAFIFDRRGFSSLWIVRLSKKVESLPKSIALLGLFLIAFILFSSISLARHYSFSSDAYDLGLFSTAVWNGGHGLGLFSSLKGNQDLLSDHFEPALYLFSPLFYIWPDVSALLIAQVLLLISAIYPIYRIARGKLGHHGVALAFVISFLLSRTLKGIYITDFYPECLLVPAFSWGMYYLLKGKDLPFTLLTLLTLFCKEDLAFSVIFMGLFIIFAMKKKRLGIFLVIAGLVTWIAATKWIIPSINADGIYRYKARFPFGITYWDNIVVVTTQPWRLWALMFTKEKTMYLLETFTPLGGLSFLGFVYFLPALPGILINLISNYWKQASVSFHYGSRIIPFTYISAIFGLRFLVEKVLLRKYPGLSREKVYSGAALGLVLMAFIFISVPDTRQLTKFTSKMSLKNVEKLEVLGRIPREASVCASYKLVPHLSLRRYIYSWENPIGGKPLYTVCEYVVLDRVLSEFGDEAVKANEKILFDAGYQKVDQDPSGELVVYRNPTIDPTLVQGVKGDP